MHMHALQSRSKNLNLAFMRTDARAAERSQNLVAARTAQEFVTVMLLPAGSSKTADNEHENVSPSTRSFSFPSLPPLVELCVFKFLNTLEGVLGISYFD